MTKTGNGQAAGHDAADWQQYWEQGSWDALRALTLAELESAPDRAELALLAASAHFETGDMVRTRAFANQARDWGAPRNDVIRILVSGLHNGLGRLTAGIGDSGEATRHFEAAMKLMRPAPQSAQLAFARQIRETARMGLLPDAARMMGLELEDMKNGGDTTGARLSILETGLQNLQHELSLSLQRNQLFRSGAETQDEDEHAALKRQSVAQLGQDLWVLERTGYKKHGFFVEFGATNGILLSNSYLLETAFAWDGICAEPNPDFFENLRKNRTCTVSQACISGETGREVDFIMADVYGGFSEYAGSDMHEAKRDGYQSAGRVQRMTTISLHDFLVENGAPHDIDYLSIDTEGSEYEILTAFPFDKWNIRLITVEHNFTPMRAQIHELLTGYGYKRTEAKWDDWYELPASE